MKKVQDRRNHEDITISDCDIIKNFLHCPKDRLIKAGLALHRENQNMHEWVKGYFGLNQKINKKKEIIMEDITDSVNAFFGKAADFHKKNKNLRNNMIMFLLRIMIVK